MGKNSVEPHADVPGTAGVVGRPILLFPAAIVAGLVLDRLLPVPVPLPQGAAVAWVVAWVVGGGLILAGLGLFAAGVRNFSRAETPLPTNRPARVLVTTGIHGRTRNPVYLGFFFAYAGIGVAALSPWMLILLPALVVTIRYGVVAREEAYLERRFGETYRDYKARVRRWL
jgi:protein-S-isoprenylcysteine O-methyltransferase Ste14